MNVELKIIDEGIVSDLSEKARNNLNNKFNTRANGKLENEILKKSEINNNNNFVFLGNNQKGKQEFVVIIKNEEDKRFLKGEIKFISPKHQPKYNNHKVLVEEGEIKNKTIYNQEFIGANGFGHRNIYKKYNKDALKKNGYSILYLDKKDTEFGNFRVFRVFDSKKEVIDSKRIKLNQTHSAFEKRLEEFAKKGETQPKGKPLHEVLKEKGYVSTEEKNTYPKKEMEQGA